MQALQQNHDVTAFARTPEKLADFNEPNLNVRRGDVLDVETVQSALVGHDAVISAIGAGAGRTTLREDGTRVIVEAMEKAGVKRLISLSSLGVGDSRSNLRFLDKYVVVPIFLRHAFADHERQEAIIRESSLDWSIVRPPHLTKGARTGSYQHGFPPTNGKLGSKISRADVADFMLKQLADDRYIHQTPGISY